MEESNLMYVLADTLSEYVEKYGWGETVEALRNAVGIIHPSDTSIMVSVDITVLTDEQMQQIAKEMEE